MKEFDVRRWGEGGRSVAADLIAEEVPVALSYNRRSHVVMMATPEDLEDFALGFSLTEGIVTAPEEVLSLQVLQREQGLEIAMTLAPERFERLARQRRNLTGRTGCGLCGAESLEQALREPRPVSHGLQLAHQALQRAIEALQAPLPLQAATGAAHCAAWCDRDGCILVAREDVGRHNALDKLVGHLGRNPQDPSGGFILVSSRASYEMVYKAAAAGAELLAAVSAPTALAIDHARRAGLTLVGFARPGRHNVYTFPERVTGPDGATSND